MLTGMAAVFDDSFIPWGSYVQVTNTVINNTSEPRTVGCISIGRPKTGRKNNTALNLSTNRIISGGKFKLLPITSGVIDPVNELHEQDLKLLSKKKPVLVKTKVTGKTIKNEIDTNYNVIDIKQVNQRYNHDEDVDITLDEMLEANEVAVKDATVEV
jgi:hypothetical protein